MDPTMSVATSMHLEPPPCKGPCGEGRSAATGRGSRTTGAINWRPTSRDFAGTIPARAPLSEEPDGAQVARSSR